MNTLHRFRSLWLALILTPALAISACSDDEGDSDDDDGAATDGDSDDSDSDDSDSDDSDSDDSDSDDSDSDDSDSDDSDSDSDSDSDDSDSDDTSSSCDGDWSLASVPFTGDGFLEECDGSPAMNCITGHYITFGDGECICLPECAAAGLSEGDACTNDGGVTCTRIENDSGTSSGVFCVPSQWGLCEG